MNANCVKYWFLFCRFALCQILVLALPLLCQSTGALSFACRLCTKLPVSGLLPSIVVACPNYRWLCFRCMLMYCAVAWLPLLVNFHHVIGCVAWFINWRLYELWCASTKVTKNRYEATTTKIRLPGAPKLGTWLIIMSSLGCQNLHT